MKPRVILIDDDRSVLDALQRSLRSFRNTWDIVSLDCPKQAWETICTTGADTIVSDLQMPLVDGLQLLAWAQQTDLTKDIPFIIVTGKGDLALRRKAIEEGATDLLHKPVDPEELIARIRSSLRLKACHDELKHHNAILEEKVEARTRELRQSRIEVVWRLAKAAEYRDEETGNHVIRVASYSRAIGERLRLPADFIETLFVTSPLHDIGKIAVPDSILRKPGKLTEAEWEIMKQHCVIGAHILQGDSKATAAFRARRGGDQSETDSPRDPLLEMASRIALTHHEKWNGGGYPRGLSGEDIPLEARIVAVADVFDALTSDRPYKAAFTTEKSLQIIRDGIGSHFDPTVSEAFEDVLDEILRIRRDLSDAQPDRLHDERYYELCAVCG